MTQLLIYTHIGDISSPMLIYIWEVEFTYEKLCHYIWETVYSCDEDPVQAGFLCCLLPSNTYPREKPCHSIACIFGSCISPRDAMPLPPYIAPKDGKLSTLCRIVAEKHFMMGHRDSQQPDHKRPSDEPCKYGSIFTELTENQDMTWVYTSCLGIYIYIYIYISMKVDIDETHFIFNT